MVKLYISNDFSVIKTLVYCQNIQLILMNIYSPGDINEIKYNQCIETLKYICVIPFEDDLLPLKSSFDKNRKKFSKRKYIVGDLLFLSVDLIAVCL